MSFWKWSRTAANNATADSSINWAEGQAPSTVNDSARAVMAAAAKYRDDIAGAIAIGGTSTAYTLTSFQSFDTLAHMDGALIAFTPHAGNGGTCTLNVDGLGAKPLRSAPSTELLAGVLVQGTPYAVTYYNATGEWILQGFLGAPGIPLGVALPFFGTTAPSSAFALPSGQAISRTTYANLFSLFGTTYGAGDGSTTFNIPDLRGYMLAGKDDMGGSAANRITNGGSGIIGTTLGATGGLETHTLTTAQLPTVTPAGSVSGTPTGTISVANQTLTTNIRNENIVTAATGTITQETVSIAVPASQATGSDTTVTATAPITASFSGTGLGASFTGTPFGSGNAHNNMPPTRICNFLMRIL